MLYIIFIILASFVFGQIINNLPQRFVAYFLNILLMVLVFMFTLGISYTADWNLYYYFYKYETDEIDFMFRFLTRLFKSNGLEFKDLFLFHLLFSILLYFVLITRFTRNFFFIFLLYLLLDYVHFVNQIRYYLGFPVMLLAFYNLLVKKRYLLSTLLIVLALLCHTGLATLLIFIPIYYIIPHRRYILFIFISSFVLGALFYLFFYSGLGSFLEHFGEYLKENNESSFIGGLFNAIPYIIMLTYLIYLTIVFVKKDDERFRDPKFKFAYKAAFFPILFLPSSFLVQILGHRYIMPFAIFWMIYFTYIISKNTQTKKFLNFLGWGFVSFIAAFSIYILPDYVLSKNHFIKEIEAAIKSISYLKDLFFY